MAYCKKWLPPTVPLKNDLAAWKLLFEDLHSNLLLAGLVQTETAGQLVIGDVAVLPANETYAGFIEYAFNDDLQDSAPVVMKLEFGLGNEGLGYNTGSDIRRSMPKIRCTISFDGTPGQVFACPQTVSQNPNNDATPNLTSSGVSTLCYAPERGFLGIVYGAGSRNKPFASTGSHGGYYGATFSVFIQRSTGPDGAPNGDGVAVYFNGLDVMQSTYNLWQGGVLSPAYSQFIGRDGAVPARRDLATRLAGSVDTVLDGEIQTQQIFFRSPKIYPFPWIVSYATDSSGHAIPEGTEFELEVFPGTLSNFIALGNETSISIDPISGQRAGIAMLFEGS